MRFAHNPLFINTVILGGTPEEKIEAAAQAGFSQIELWRQDVEKAGGGVPGIIDLVSLKIWHLPIIRCCWISMAHRTPFVSESVMKLW